MKKYSRRDMIREAAGGYGALALGWMLQQDAALAASTGKSTAAPFDLRPKQPHFAAKAKRVIFIYISGGPSTIDMFDPKPASRKVRRQACALRNQGQGAERLAADHGESVDVQPSRPERRELSRS